MDPAPETVPIFETADQIQFAMAKGLLEDAGIPFFLTGGIATLVQPVDEFLSKRVGVHVARNREEEARELLEPLLHPVPGASSS